MGAQTRERRVGLQTARTDEVEQVAVYVVGARLGDDVDRAAGRAPVFGGKAVGQYGELLQRRERNVGEDRLPPPRIIAGAAVYLESRLTASAAVDHKERVVKKEVALAARRLDRRVEQRQVRQLAPEDRRFINLL